MYWIGIYRIFELVIWVRIITVTFVFRSLKVPCYGNRLISGTNSENSHTTPSSFALVFHNELEYHNVDMCVNSSDEKFDELRSSITLKFTRLVCVQHASISTRVSLTTFAKGRHCYRPGGIHTRLCRAFLVCSLSLIIVDLHSCTTIKFLQKIQ